MMDAEQICKIQRDTWRTTYPSREYGVSKHDIDTYTKHWISTANIQYFSNQIKNLTEKDFWAVAVRGDMVLGHLRAHEDSSRVFIDMFYIKPTEQNHGLGKKMMLEIIEWAESKPIVVDVVEYNLKAIAFYRTFGFIFKGVVSNNAKPLPTNKTLPLIRIIKESDTVNIP